LLSVKLTLDVFNWSLALDRHWLPVSELINLGVLILAFRYELPTTSKITTPQKVYFGFVLALAALIGYRGFLVPQHVDKVLPFMVPPLHARFLASMYLSGATFMALGIAAKRWAEVRVVVPMIAIWTGMLGLISLLHLEAFDWSRKQVWIWFIAYTSYPLIAAWLTWQHRRQESAIATPLMSGGLKIYLAIQGFVVTVLAMALLIAPNTMVALWPWKITPLLAQVYSAPFLSYGLGSLLASKQRVWPEVKIVIYAELVFALGVLCSSLYHAQLFNFQRLPTGLWFGGFALATLMLGLFGMVPALRQSALSPPEG
jgi:hypothetical protein